MKVPHNALPISHLEWTAVQSNREADRVPSQSGLCYRKWQQPACFLGKSLIPCVWQILEMGCSSKQPSGTRDVFSHRATNREGSVLASSSHTVTGAASVPRTHHPVALGRHVHFMPVSKDMLIFPKPLLTRLLSVPPVKGRMLHGHACKYNHHGGEDALGLHLLMGAGPTR